MNKIPALKDNYKYKGLRRQLAETIHRKGIKDQAVLEALEKIPRHFFLDSAFAEHAYEDKPMPIGCDQTISQPYTVAYQSELLKIKKGDKVLEIGLGSGYQACILRELGAEVYSIDRIPSLVDKSKKLLSDMGYDIHVFHGDGSRGLPQYAPFDKILVTAAAPDIPESLKTQLKLQGIMIIPVGTKQSQKMIRIIRSGENTYEKTEFDYFRFVPLIGKEGWEA
jgi:protein-L-isoaspartate(D-aspartate) O-methyltransferase